MMIAKIRQLTGNWKTGILDIGYWILKMKMRIMSTAQVKQLKQGDD